MVEVTLGNQKINQKGGKMESIYRRLEPKDKQFIDVDLARPKRQKTSREKFQLELIKHEQEATEKGLPFARHAARDYFEREIQKQVDKQLQENGEVDASLLKVPEMDWAKYSDLKNFEVVDTGETYDEHLTIANPGLTVMAKKTVYKFKGYGNPYTIMESGPDSIKRAQDKAWKDKAEFESKLKENPKKS